MMMGRSPMFGLFVILGALLRGLIALLIVRVLAEVGLAVLAHAEAYRCLKIFAQKQIVRRKAVAVDKPRRLCHFRPAH